MIILDAPQGSLDWIIQRLFRLTASDLSANITSTGQLSKSKAALKSIDKLIAGFDLAHALKEHESEISEMDEWELKKFMANYTGDSFSGNIHTERGKELEPDAIAAMQDRIGRQIVDVGMCVMGDDPNGLVSCSPDGLIYKASLIDEGAEVKAPCLSTYLRFVREDILPPEHALQVHAGMAICEVDAWNFGAYFKGKPLFYKKVNRDSFTDKLGDTFEKFNALYRDQFSEVQTKIESLKELSSGEEDAA